MTSNHNYRMGACMVHFDLAATENRGCRLVVSHQALGAISQEMQGNFVAGWRELIGRHVRAHLQQGD